MRVFQVLSGGKTFAANGATSVELCVADWMAGSRFCDSLLDKSGTACPIATQLTDDDRAKLLKIEALAAPTAPGRK
jgi:hypothetical protein